MSYAVGLAKSFALRSAEYGHVIQRIARVGGDTETSPSATQVTFGGCDLTVTSNERNSSQDKDR